MIPSMKTMARRCVKGLLAMLALLASRPQSAYWTAATGKKRNERRD